MRVASSTLLFGTLLSCAVVRAPAPATALAGEALPFIEDDAPRALALAQTKGLPVFVDAWAPW